MRRFHIKVNANIEQKRWDENDEPFLTTKHWSTEIECDGIEKLEKLLELNQSKELKLTNIPSLILGHIEFDNDLDYDSINDEIVKLQTKVVREID